jgi:hypothetical protein
MNAFKKNCKMFFFLCFIFFQFNDSNALNIGFVIDMNLDTRVDLTDAIIGLQKLSDPDDISQQNSSVNLDDIVKILQILSDSDSHQMDAALVLSIQENSGQFQSHVPVSILCNFKQGDVPSTKTLYAHSDHQKSRNSSSEMPVQMNNITTYADGSIKSADITFIIPGIDPNETQTIALIPSDLPLNTKHISLDDVLASGFNTSIVLVSNDNIIKASFQELIANYQVTQIYSGPISSKWQISGPFIGAGGSEQSIQAAFYVVAYEGCERIRVTASVFNNSGQNPKMFDLTMSVGNIKFVRKNCPLYPFTNWTKVMWWGQEPQITIIEKTDPLFEQHIVDTIFINPAFVASTNVPFSFGHIFKKGDMKPDDHFVARFENGKTIPVQLDRKAFHADGSLRHGIISLIIPELPYDLPQKVSFFVNQMAANDAESTIYLSDFIQTNYQTRVSIIENGKTYQADAKDLLQIKEIKTWLSGPLVKEWHVSAPLKTSDYRNHPHLSAHFYIRAYKDSPRVRTAVIIENNWTYVDNPKNFTYDISIQSNDHMVYQQNDFVHYHHARWRKTFWQNVIYSEILNDPFYYISHDIHYMLKSKAIPNFDPELIGNIPESVLSKTRTEWQNNNTPMSAGLINNWTYGSDMWPILKWTGQYLLSMDPRIKQAMIGNAELAGSFPLHYRDSNTMLPVSIDDYPHCTTHWKDHVNPETQRSEAPSKCPEGSDCTNPHLVDPARKPAYTFIPYLVTGDYYFLEELHFWTNFCMIHDAPSDRDFSAGIIKGDDADIAFSLRTLGQAAYITPEDHPLKSYFTQKLLANINYYHNAFLGDQSNNLGCSTLNQANSIVYKDDYLTWGMAYLFDLGFTSTWPILSWKAQFPVHRLTSGDKFCWIFSSNDQLKVADTDTGPRYESMKDVYDNSKSDGVLDDGGFQCNSQEMADYLKQKGLTYYGKIGEIIGKPWASAPPAMIQPALAVAVDVNVNAAHAAWDQYMSRSVIPNYLNEGCPNYNIVPRRYEFTGEDSDNDGVIDGFDECPDSSSGETVNIFGCPIQDTDADGIIDSLDACPGSLSGVLVDAIGCHQQVNDSDNDGISDDLDQCPNTPQNTPVDNEGCPVGSVVYEVGPEKAFAQIIDCPTYDLKAGDEIHVFYKPEPYVEKFLLYGQGTESEPIVLKGIPDENGNLPIIDGSQAVTHENVNCWNEDRQIIKVGQASDLLADYIVIEGFELKNANNTRTFFDGKGNEKKYLDNACAIRIEYGRHITIRNCQIHSNGNGIQSGTTDNQMKLIIERCHIHNNGVCSWFNAYIHNLYLSGENDSEVIVQFCIIGALLSNGQQAKTRAHNAIFRYNHIEGGRNSQLDLVEDVNNMDSEANVYVYGNVIVKPDDSENSSVIHFGGDQQGSNRSGTLYFFNNTCIIKDTKTWGTRRLFNVSGEKPEIQADNNIFYINTASTYNLIEGSTKLSGQNNWMSLNIEDPNEYLTDTILGENPGFVDFQEGHYHLMINSQCIDKGVRNQLVLHTSPLNAQMGENMTVEHRIPINGYIDIGAFEYGLDLPDEDHDGILDVIDECPDTPPEISVNPKGCAAQDSDNDGIRDPVDYCPFTPADVPVDSMGCPSSETSRIFKVGPGMTFEHIIDCPTHDLMPGDEIHVYYQADPYHEKFLIMGNGSSEHPIRIIGIPDPSGKMPVLDGMGAASSSEYVCTNDERQIIKLGQDDQSAGNVIIEGFEIRNANNTQNFMNSSGNTHAYNDNASAIRIENGHDITIRNCFIHDNGNGIQTGKETHHVLIESCCIDQNGVCSFENSFIHNMYLSGRNGNTIIVQYCYIGELLSQGQQVKSRAEKFIFRYNWLEGGRNAQLDLVEDYEVSDVIAYDAWVYGNTIIKPDQSDNSVMIHFGGDQPDTNRMGTLYFYNNTCIIKDTKTWGAHRVFKISKDNSFVKAYNNIFYLKSSISYDLLSGSSNLSGSNNWLSTSIKNTEFFIRSITGDSPLFMDEAQDNFHLQSDSPCKDTALIESIPEDYQPEYQYKKDLDYTERHAIDNGLDIGAFEYGIPKSIETTFWPNPPWPENGIYVAQTGMDTDLCGDKNNPCRSIKHALSKLSGENRQSIYVFPGTYVENQIYIKNNTRVLGLEGSKKTKIHTEANNGVFFLGEEDAPIVNAEISGFEIYGNYDDDSAGRQSGLIRLYHASNISITHCIIHDAPFDGDCIKVSGYIENLLLDHLIVYNPASRPEEKAAPFQENIDIFGSMPRRDGRSPVRNIVIRNSWLFHTDKGGHWLLYGKIDVENMLIENNIFGPSAGIDDSKGAGYGPGGVGIGTHENDAQDGLTCVNSHTVVRNNIFMFIRGDAPLEIIDSHDIWVYNNLFYQNSGPLVRSAMMFMDHVYDVGKVNLLNNIFQHNQPQRDGIKASMFRNRNDGLPDPFFKGYNLYYDNITATEIDYTDETGSVYPSIAPFYVQLPEPLIPNDISLEDIDKIKKSFTIQQKSLIKRKGINPYEMEDYPNWMPSVTDTPIDTFMNFRGRSNWDMGPFLINNDLNHSKADKDHDGILDAEDQCPDTPFQTPVDDLGCSVALPKETVFLSFDAETGDINDGFDNWEYRSPEKNPVYKMTEVGGFYSRPDSEGFHKAFFPYKNISRPRVMRYSYIDINTQMPARGTGCLEFVFTGGAYQLPDNTIAYSGMELFYKSQFDAYIESGQSPYSTIPLFADEQFYVKFADSKTRIFEEAQGADRLSVWIFLPKGSHENSSFPIRTIQYYPYIETSEEDHYYHWLSNIGMGGWTHLVIDAHPQRNNTGAPVDDNGNPLPYEYYRAGGHDYPGNAVEYFNRTVAFALRLQLGDYNFPTPVYLDHFAFFKSHQPENDETISNLGLGYNPETHEFDIGFCDKYRGNGCHATYEIRYSFRPITNASYSKTKLCTVVQAPNLDFTYATDIKGQIKKPTTGYNQLWGLLKLEPEDESRLKPGIKIYFAVKDISNRTYPDRDPYDEEMVEVDGLGQVRRIDLIKTIGYEIIQIFTDTP